MMMTKITLCTIIAKNYLASARVFTNSFLKHNPDGKVFVLLVDDVSNHFNPEQEKFTLVNVNEIGIKNLESFCFKYNILEQNTGVKAHFLKYLFKKYNFPKLAYFDPDILFTNNLENLWKLLDKKSIVLTPHITMPITDDKHPSEYDIMRSGCYNLGFIALKNNKITEKFLDWWIPHLMEEGYSDVDRGIFVDQKWIDLVPSIFDDVYIIRHPGYNVAYWNFMQRQIKIENKKIEADGKPVYFVHFSGFSPENMERVSKHQNRFALKNLEHIRPLFELYRDSLVENDNLNIKNWKCKFNYFDNGIKISDQMRKIYSEFIKQGKDFGNPFVTTKSNSFLAFLNENIDNNQPPITRLWYQIYKERKDLHSVFPDPLNRDRESFAKWLNITLDREYDFDKRFLPSHIYTEKNFNPNFRNHHLKSDQNQSQVTTSRQYLNNDSEGTGINIAGYFQGEFGIAEAGRNFVKAIKTTNIPFVLNNITTPHHRNQDYTFTEFSKKNPHKINLVITNADQIESFAKEVGPEYFKNKYNIAIWSWELNKFPEKWLPNLKYFDEIWTMSAFMTDTMSKQFPIPVVTITVPIEPDESKLIKNRKKFEIKEDEFAFLVIFDYASVFERKNPIGAIEAFNKAFGKNAKGVRLIIKSINGSKYPDKHKILLKYSNQENISLISDHIERNDVLSLLASSDCFVSLHKAEGLGLNIADAMFAGKPVIATSYGGNNDIMNVNNSLPVKYNLVKLDKDFGPYKKENVWAEPDIEHAASLMKYVYENRIESKKIGESASNHIKQFLSYDITGKKISNRINVIGNSDSYG